MADPEGKLDGAGNETNKINLDDPDTAAVELDVDESKAHLINANGGAGRGDNPDEYKVVVPDQTPASSDGEVSFNGLGKEEVMRYANDPFWVRLRWILFILFWVGWLAMLVTAIAIIVLAPRCPPRPDLKWYQTETVYQVFPKSFKDSNNDGIGDFKGLKDKLDYIEEDLGINAIWINSMYEVDDTGSALGVVDHKVIDKSFGATMGQFKSWLKKMRKEDKNVILDLIPNQTSKKHMWFQKSQAGEEPYKDYYVWSDGTTAPNNWTTVDGKPAWTFDSTRGAMYFHQYSEEYPDLNLNNEDVRNEIKDIMKFWMDAGVSGFHIQGLEYLVENPDLTQPEDSVKSQTRNYEGNFGFLEELREVANDYSDKPGREKALMGTVYHANPNQTLEYWGPKDKKRLHVVSPVLKDLNAACHANCVRGMVESYLTDDRHQWLGLQLGNEHVQRIASRMDDSTADAYQSRLVVAFALQLLLPGTPINYYGDEFGQRDGNVGSGDPADDYRTPMQWNKQENAGFSGEGVSPWLPVGSMYMKDNVQAGQAHFSDPTPLEAFIDLVELRGNESMQWGKTKICTPNDDLLMFTRKATRFPYFLTIINMGSQNLHVAPEDLGCLSSEKEGTIMFHSREEEVDEKLNFEDFALYLEPYDVIVVQFPSDD